MLTLPTLITVLLPLVAQSPTPPADALQTVAERTEYKATARHADVVALCQELARSSPNAQYANSVDRPRGVPCPS